MVPRETEDSLYRRVLSGLKQFLDKVRDAIKTVFARFRTAPSPAVAYEATPTWQKAVDGIVSFLRDMVPDEADNPVVEFQIGYTRSLLKGIPDDVYRLILDEVVVGTGRGDTVDQLTQHVDRLLDTTRTPRWAGRARAIAVTEATRTWNASLYASALDIQQRNRRPIYKEWVSHHDDRVRPTHLQADGQTALLSQPFQIGTAALMFPGDPNGPPDQVISCRCSLRVSTNL